MPETAYSPLSASPFRPDRATFTPLVVAARVGVLALPVVLLLLGAYRANQHGRGAWLLLLGTACQALLSTMVFVSRHRARQSLGNIVLILYLIALSWFWLDASYHALDDWYVHFCQAVLLVVSMVFFALQVFADSGAQQLRKANLLAQKLCERKDWPDNLLAIRDLPEVKAFREALYLDASPAFPLLRHERPEVRMAALAALEFRHNYKPGQAELVLEAALRAEEPPVRAAACSALANVTQRPIIERLAKFLLDRSPLVRRAAADALMWDTERRWSWIRQEVRQALSDPNFQDDGPLLHQGQTLSAEAVDDLMAWIAEKGFLATRAALTVGVHYGKALIDHPNERLINDLKKQLVNPHAPAVLRNEIVQLLHANHLLDRTTQEHLLDPMNPAILRLFAAECLLTNGGHAGAVHALRDVARMPNREIALATADVVQRRLGVDLGLAIGQPLPQLHSRAAVEITRRVMLWAQQGDYHANSDPAHR